MAPAVAGACGNGSAVRTVNRAELAMKLRRVIVLIIGARILPIGLNRRCTNAEKCQKAKCCLAAPRTPSGVRFSMSRSQGWLASLAHPWLHSCTPPACKRSPEGCLESSPGVLSPLSLSHPGRGARTNWTAAVHESPRRKRSFPSITPGRTSWRLSVGQNESTRHTKSH